jgi:hypothetical protein
MADYKGIKGFKVQSLASDPSGPEGQVWYNTATNVLKYQALVGAWASSPAINNGRSYNVGSGNTATAGLIFGGSQGGAKKYTEAWNGTAWSEVADLLVGTSQSGGATSGTQTATLSFGMPSGNTETWNGTSWTEGANMGSGRYLGQCSGGTVTAAIGMGGSPYTSNCEIYDGTSWTEVNNQIAARGEKAGCGSTTSAISAGGRPPPGTGIAELYDGTSWAVTGTMNNGRYYQSAAGDSGTLAIMFGGIPPPSGLKYTESFDGTSWTSLAEMGGTYQGGGGGVGNTTGAFAVGTAGATGPTTVELWTVANAAKTVTVS